MIETAIYPNRSRASNENFANSVILFNIAMETFHLHLVFRNADDGTMEVPAWSNVLGHLVFFAVAAFYKVVCLGIVCESLTLRVKP